MLTLVPRVLLSSARAATTIDLEERLFSPKWRRYGAPMGSDTAPDGSPTDATEDRNECVLRARPRVRCVCGWLTRACRFHASFKKGEPAKSQLWYGKKPLERRPLWHPASLQPQGYVSCWVDILSPLQREVYPRVPITPPTFEWELRVVVWKVRKVPPGDSVTKQSDLFVRASMDTGAGQGSAGGKSATTDVHWRAKGGRGSFNWRCVFPVTSSRDRELKAYALRLQCYDKDLVKWNDLLGECEVPLGDLFHRGMEFYSHVNLDPDFDGMIDAGGSTLREWERAQEDRLARARGADGDDGDGGGGGEGGSGGSDAGEAGAGVVEGLKQRGRAAKRCTTIELSDDGDIDDWEARGRKERVLDCLLWAVHGITRGFWAGTGCVMRHTVRRCCLGDREEADNASGMVADLRGKLGFDDEEGDRPEDSHWFPLTRLRELTDKEEAALHEQRSGSRRGSRMVARKARERAGEVLVSVQLVPKGWAARYKAGSGRQEPNTFPTLPEPQGRMRWSWNPFYVLYSCLVRAAAPRMRVSPPPACAPPPPLTQPPPRPRRAPSCATSWRAASSAWASCCCASSGRRSCRPRGRACSRCRTSPFRALRRAPSSSCWGPASGGACTASSWAGRRSRCASGGAGGWRSSASASPRSASAASCARPPTTTTRAPQPRPTTPCRRAWRALARVWYVCVCVHAPRCS